MAFRDIEENIRKLWSRLQAAELAINSRISGLSKHTAESTPNDRAYFGTGETATNSGSTYLGMGGSGDSANSNIAWIVQAGVTKFAFQRDSEPMQFGDTGWVSTGLSFSTASGWAVVNYRLRKTGTRVFGKVTVAYTGATVTGTSTEGNWDDQMAVITMPSGWRNGMGWNVTVPFVQSGVKTAFGRANNGTGAIDFTHGTPGLVVASGASFDIQLDYYTD